MAVDTNEVIQKAVYGAGVPSGPVPTGYGDWPLDPKTLPYLKPDIDGAKKLLAEAGYPNGGFTIEIRCSPAVSGVRREHARRAGDARKLNVTAQVQQWSGATLSAGHNQEIQTGGKEGGEIFATRPTRSGPGPTAISSRTSTRTGRTTTAGTAIRRWMR